jgi:hypothetical protein
LICFATPDFFRAKSLEAGKLQLYLNIDTRGEIQFHQRVYRLLRGLKYIKQSFVGSHFELLT